MWNTLIGGAIALAGVALAQWWQSKRAREDADIRRAGEKAGRLRAAYHEVVTAADWLRARAFELVDLSDELRRDAAEWSSLVEMLTEADQPTSAARAALLLEADDADRDVLAAFTSARSADASFKLVFIKRVMSAPEDPDDSRVELFDALSELEGTVDEVAKLARERLADLEKPSPLKKRWGSRT